MERKRALTHSGNPLHAIARTARILRDFPASQGPSAVFSGLHVAVGISTTRAWVTLARARNHQSDATLSSARRKRRRSLNSTNALLSQISDRTPLLSGQKRRSPEKGRRVVSTGTPVQ